MSIVDFLNSDGDKSYQYKQPREDILWERFCKLLKLLEEMVSKLPDLDFSYDLSVNGKILGDIIVRVDKRSDYFLIFHEQTKISEIKKASLYAYWILKLKPISVVSSNMNLRTKYSYINETFAMFVLFSVFYEEAYRKNKIFSLSEEYVQKLGYAFKFWDVSKESLMLVAETLHEDIVRQ